MQDKPLPKEFYKSLSQKRLDTNYNAMMRIHDAAKLYHERMRRHSQLDGLSSSYRVLIFHLSHMKPGVTQLDLARAAHLKPPSVSVTLQKMERDGIITRVDNENDLRETLVYLTDKGKAIDNRFKIMHDEGDAAALEGFSEVEISTLCSLLNRVIDNLAEEN